MKFELIQLPYAPDALEPAIGKETIEFHHGKHLQTYVNNLNKLIQGTPFENKTLKERLIPYEYVPVAVRPEKLPGQKSNAGPVLPFDPADEYRCP